MIQPRVIQIEEVRHDILTGALEAVAVRRDADGQVTRCPIRTSADPSCTRDETDAWLRRLAMRL